MRPELKAKFCKSEFTKDSKILEIQGNTEIGRQLSQSVVVPPLKSGVTFAVFHADGNLPVESDSLKR